MSSALLPLLAVAPSRSSRQCSLGDCDSGGLPLASLSCDMTWPMEEMPHSDVAGFCLAAPWHYASKEGSRWAPLRGGYDDMRCMPWSGLICDGKDLSELPWAGGDDDMHCCDEKDRFLPNVAVAGDNLHDNGTIEASTEHPTDRIWNAGAGRMGHKQVGWRGRLRGGRSYDLGRSSIRGCCILSGWIWWLKAFPRILWL